MHVRLMEEHDARRHRCHAVTPREGWHGARGLPTCDKPLTSIARQVYPFGGASSVARV